MCRPLLSSPLRPLSVAARSPCSSVDCSPRWVRPPPSPARSSGSRVVGEMRATRTMRRNGRPTSVIVAAVAASGGRSTTPTNDADETRAQLALTQSTSNSSPLYIESTNQGRSMNEVRPLSSDPPFAVTHRTTAAKWTIPPRTANTHPRTTLTRTHTHCASTSSPLQGRPIHADRSMNGVTSDQIFVATRSFDTRRTPRPITNASSDDKPHS